MGISGPDDLNIGIDVTAEGQDVAEGVAEGIAKIRNELKLLKEMQLSGVDANEFTIAQQKQLRDELAASARQIAADRKAALAQERADREASLSEQKSMSAAEREVNAQVTADIKKATRDIAAEKAAARAAEKAADKQSRDELAASARQIAVTRAAAAAQERTAAKEAQQNAAANAAAQKATAQQALAAGQAQLAQSRAVQSTSAAQKEHIATIQGQSEAYGFLIRQLAAVTAAFAGFQLFRTFIQEGLEFNRIIETSNLGIASLITSQAEMKNSQGAIITGVDKLRVAQSLATDQVQKLRVAGLQTTATTEQLVGAYQQAVAIGLRWGLTLDQIRIITVQMSQAAGALGVPLNQMNEEIRSLLTGVISPRNTRIATALGITNDQVKAAQKAGTLFQFVTDRLEAFSVAGESTAKTFVGVMSNIKEALQNLSGDATKPLFDALKLTGQETLEDIFDLNNARITTKFAGILDVAKEVFGSLGDLLAQGISSGLEGAKEMNKWLQDNRLEVEKIFEASKLVGSEIALLASEVFSMIIPFGDIATNVGAIQTGLVGVGLVVAGIHEMLQIITVVLGTIGFAVISTLVAPMSLFLKLLGSVVGVFNKEWGAAITSAGDKGIEMVKGLAAGIVDYTKTLTNGGNAVDQYLAKVDQLNNAAAVSTAAHQKLSDALQKATDAELSETKALDLALKERQITQQQYSDAVNKVMIASVQKQIAAEKEYFNSLNTSDDRERKRTLVIIQELKKREAALQQNVSIKSIAEPPAPKDSALKEEEAVTTLVKAQLTARLKDLKIALDSQKISYDQYYQAVIAANQDAIDKQIAALHILEAAQTDKGAQADTAAKIKALMVQRAQIVDDETEAEREAYVKLDDDVVKAHVELLKDQGRLVDAAALETDNKFKLLIAKLKAEVAAGRTGAAAQLGLVEQLFGIDQAKVKVEELNKQVKTITDTLATQLSEINTESTTHAITEKEARDKIVDAYVHARDQLVAILPLLREQAALTGDPTAINNVQELSIKIQQMGISIQQIGDDLLKLKTGAREAFETGLGAFLDDATKGAKSLHDAWRDAAQGIIDSLRKIATQMLANLIIQKSLELFGFSGGGLVNFGATAASVVSGGATSGGSTVHAASGGHITGPGSPTSDSIPAWLSNGEYVVRASAVRAVGVSLLDQINKRGAVTPRSRRTRGYAEGGLVAQTSNSSSVNSHLTVSLERGLVLAHLESDEGQRVQLKFLEKNSSKIRNLLGGR